MTASKNSNYHLCAVYYVSDTVLSTLCIYAYLILVISQGPLCDFLHFTDEETDTQQAVLTFPQLIDYRAT